MLLGAPVLSLDALLVRFVTAGHTRTTELYALGAGGCGTGCDGVGSGCGSGAGPGPGLGCGDVGPVGGIVIRQHLARCAAVTSDVRFRFARQLLQTPDPVPRRAWASPVDRELGVIGADRS